MTMNIPQKIAVELGIRNNQIDEVIRLFGEDSTIPFIARYRKENTGGLDEIVLRQISERLQYLQTLEDRKETVIKSIEEQGKLTDELKKSILDAELLRTVEDLYLPYKPKRKTRGSVAKSKGLEPLAEFILSNPDFKGDLSEIISGFINPEKGVNSSEEALAGAKDIIAESISEHANVREKIRDFIFKTSQIVSAKSNSGTEGSSSHKKDVYEIYYDFTVDARQIKPHQTLALNRGEKEKFLKISLISDEAQIHKKIYKVYFPFQKSIFDKILKDVVEDAFKRLLSPSLERELRNHMTETADKHAIRIFNTNLRQLLLQPPVKCKRIIGIDPGFVSGSKVAVIDDTGKYLKGTTIYPHPPQKKVTQAKEILLSLINEFKIELIAIGNGTASRETEVLIAELIKENDLSTNYIIVNEAGASVYSASDIAREEFPDLDASQRGNISIARRVLDPLAELVKIDPKSIGVGLYQHDVNQSELMRNLEDVVESCVNYVGVDLNTASISLLNYVSGLNKKTAKSIVTLREKKGKFTSREQLLGVSGLGAKSYEQMAGFLKIRDGDNPLDNTFIHPESYSATQKLLDSCGVPLIDIRKKTNLLLDFVEQQTVPALAAKIDIGVPTLEDIIDNLKKPGRDPREELPKPILRKDVLSLEDLAVGSKTLGTVRNVVDFGAFIDIGLKNDALLHISKISRGYIKHPLEHLNVGDILEVSVVSVDIAKQRVALSLVD